MPTPGCPMVPLAPGFPSRPSSSAAQALRLQMPVQRGLCAGERGSVVSFMTQQQFMNFRFVLLPGSSWRTSFPGSKFKIILFFPVCGVTKPRGPSSSGPYLPNLSLSAAPRAGQGPSLTGAGVDQAVWSCAGCPAMDKQARGRGDCGCDGQAGESSRAPSRTAGGGPDLELTLGVL